jgi:hypothetical protein
MFFARVLDLADADIYDQLAELVGITRTGAT